MNHPHINIAYFGSPDFSASVLKKIIQDPVIPLRIKLVCTQPDKPVGRKKILTPTEVKKMALQYSIPCISHMPNIQELKKHDIQVCIVYAYGNIIPLSLLQGVKYGFWNIHPSLLPLYRGPSPVAYPLILGDKMTGVSLMKMDEKLDHGPVLAQKSYPIAEKDTHQTLIQSLSELGYNVLKDYCINHTSGKNNEQKEQDHSQATYTKLLHKNDGYIKSDLIDKALKGEYIKESEMPDIIKEYILKYRNRKIYSNTGLYKCTYVIWNMYKGLYQWPGIWTYCRMRDTQKRVKLLELDRDNDILLIKTVQIEGKTPVSFSEIQKSPYFSFVS